MTSLRTEISFRLSCRELLPPGYVRACNYMPALAVIMGKLWLEDALQFGPHTWEET
jgi:hypothetical protein